MKVIAATVTINFDIKVETDMDDDGGNLTYDANAYLKDGSQITEMDWGFKTETRAIEAVKETVKAGRKYFRPTSKD
jgi:hypothetical protein